MKALKAIFRIIIGLIFGIGSGLALSPAAAAFVGEPGDARSASIIWAVILGSALLGFFAPTIRRAFGRGFLLLGVCVFALPLSVMLLSGRVAHDMVTASEHDAMTAVGAGIAGTLMTGASAFIGFFLGAIFIVAGLVLALGGRREVFLARQ
jgi:hypothetical protein